MLRALLTILEGQTDTGSRLRIPFCKQVRARVLLVLAKMLTRLATMSIT